MDTTTNNTQIKPGLAAIELGILEEQHTKTCRVCGRTLPITSFNKSWKSADGHQHICKECNRAISLTNLEKAHEALSGRGENRTRRPRRGIKRALTLADFTDSQLAAELNRRGYKGSISKTSTLSI